MALQTRPLGTTHLEITRVGFGAWAISGTNWGYGWGPQDDADSIAAIHAAVEAGVNWIDTAAVYGVGHSEEVVGRALQALPEADRPYVFTKAGLVYDDGDTRGMARKVMKPESVRRELEGSLRRLGVEAIDLYQVHWPGDGELLGGVGMGATQGGSPHATPLEEYWQLMADLKAEGKVRAVGVSNHGVAQLEAAERIAHVDALQPPFSAIHRGAAAELEWSEANGTGVIVYSPMASGLLTGAFSAERVAALPSNDWRASHPDFTTGLEANLAVAKALAVVAGRRGVTTSAAAVAWVLAWPGVTGAIVGARRPEQIADWAPGASLTLDDADLDEVAAAIERSGAGEGPTRPRVPATR
jgi:aryl-alcohol dehydrogenase-like predicted oxidoreductase